MKSNTIPGCITLNTNITTQTASPIPAKKLLNAFTLLLPISLYASSLNLNTSHMLRFYVERNQALCTNNHSSVGVYTPFSSLGHLSSFQGLVLLRLECLPRILFLPTTYKKVISCFRNALLSLVEASLKITLQSFSRYDRPAF